MSGDSQNAYFQKKRVNVINLYDIGRKFTKDKRGVKMFDIIKRQSGYFVQMFIHGTIQGNIWMGGLPCEKSVNYTVRDGTHFTDGKRESLRDAVLRITNDGDFQSCELLANSYLQIKLTRANKTLTRNFDLNNKDLFPTIQDCISDEYPMYDYLD